MSFNNLALYLKDLKALAFSILAAKLVASSCAPFTKCITKIDGRTIDEVEI